MPRVRNEDVQDRQGIRIETLALVEGWVSVVISSLSIVTTQFGLLLHEKGFLDWLGLREGS